MARHPVLEGAARALALAPGTIPLGLVFGATAAQAGFTPAMAVAMYATVFAGGTQLAAVGLHDAGAPVLAVVALVAVVNARYVLLGAATLDLARRHGAAAWQRWLLALGVIDEAYALQAAWAKQGRATVAGLLAIPATLMVVLAAATAVGALVGAGLPSLEPWGLDYALPGLFVGLVGIFADTRARLAVAASTLVAAGALALLGLGILGVLLVPPGAAFLAGELARRRERAGSA